mgnify:CR=1 FL=1
MAHSIVITIKDGSSGDVVAIDQIPIDPKISDKLIAKVEIVDVPSRPRRDDRSPLHPRALRLSDLRVGMRIRVCSKTLNITKYTAIVASGSFSDDIGYKVPLVVIEQGPLGYEGVGYHEMYAADMGLIKHRASGQWNCSWYTVAAE